MLFFNEAFNPAYDTNCVSSFLEMKHCPGADVFIKMLIICSNSSFDLGETTVFHAVSNY